MLKRSLISLSVALACLSAQATSYYMLTPIVNAPAQQGAGTQAQPDIAVSLTSYALPSGQVGVPYTGFDFKPLLFVTGDATYSGTGAGWSVASGSLPAGLTLNANGTLSGTPTTVGDSSFEIKASYKTKTGKQVYQVAVVSGNVALATATPNSAQVGIAYQYDLKPLLTVNGDTNFNANNVTWSVVNSTLPAGLSLRTDGTIAGTPTASGTGTVTARATYLNAQGEQTYQVVSHEITVSLASATVPQGLVGQSFNYDVKPLLSIKTDGVTTANATPTWSVSAGALPAGLTLNADGTITGTPTAASNSNVTLRATYNGINGEQTYQFVTLNVTVALATAIPSTAQIGVVYQYDLKPLLTVTGDTNFNVNDVTWTLGNTSLPAGLILNSNGTITGTPTAEGTFPITVTASYKNKMASHDYSMVITSVDPYYNNVVFLAHFDGNLTDTSLSNTAVTAAAETFSSSVKQFGISSVFFNGSTSKLTLPASSHWNQNTPYTIESWVYPQAGGWIWSQVTRNFLNLIVGSDGSVTVDKSSIGLQLTTPANSLPLNTWSHLAVSSDGTTVRVYINGIQKGSFGAGAVAASAGNVYIGGYGGGNGFFRGYLDDFRVTSGVARYTTSSIAVPTQSWPNQ